MKQCTKALTTGTLSFPADQLAMVKELITKYGWTFTPKEKCGLDEGIEDIRVGRIVKVDNIDVFYNGI